MFDVFSVVGATSPKLQSRVPYLTAHQALGHPWPTYTFGIESQPSLIPRGKIRWGIEWCYGSRLYSQKPILTSLPYLVYRSAVHSYRGTFTATTGHQIDWIHSEPI